MTSSESRMKWERFLKGDREAYAWIYDFYVQDLFGYGLRFCSDREMVKDCIQEVFTNLYKSRKRLRVPGNIKVYLFVCLKNGLLRAIRKESRYASVDPVQAAPFGTGYTVEDQFIREEDRGQIKQRIDEILSVLTPRQREIIYYRYVQEMSFEDISGLMDLNYQSAQNLIQRSLKKLRDFYGTLPSLFL